MRVAIRNAAKAIIAKKQWEIILPPNQNTYILSRGQIAWCIADSFLNGNYGYLNWDTLTNEQRLACLHDYFTRLHNTDELVKFERVSKTEFVEPDSECIDINVIVHAKPMETQCETIVDFANANLHIHRIQDTVTQEELIFSTHSECFLGLHLFPNSMLANECIVFHNVWRHASYTGYGETFRFNGPVDAIQTVIAMDATSEDDLRKAYIGFSSVPSDSVSTGNWGCGAFQCNPFIKFFEQILAAQWAKKKTLYYSTFGDLVQMEQFQYLLRFIKSQNWSWKFVRDHLYEPYFIKSIIR